MPPQWIGYEEYIERFFFREKCSIKIPKEVREKAFSLQLDIEIQSTDGNDYLNSKSLPSYSFYGYVVLVFRDYAQIQIPITQPRQILYYEKLEEAYTNWYSFYLSFLASYQLAFINNESLVAIGTALGATVGEPSFFCPVWGGFEEIPLREVYVKSRFGTRFALEISWHEALDVTYGECSYSPTSVRQDDPIKDSGLPSNGVQPTNNSNPLNPYDDYPAASEEMELGDWSNNSKLTSIDNKNPDNEIVREYYIEIDIQVLPDESGNTIEGKVYYACEADSALDVTFPSSISTFNSCGYPRSYRLNRVAITGTSTILDFNALIGFTWNAVIREGAIPPNDVVTVVRGAC